MEFLVHELKDNRIVFLNNVMKINKNQNYFQG